MKQTKIIGIYKITNKINGKSYIGQSHDIFARWEKHLSNKNALKLKEKPLYDDLNKYGKENFLFEILEECSENELNQKEEYWTQYYNTYHDGYNMTPGGKKVKITEEQLNNIIYDLAHTTMKHEEIAKKYNLCIDTIQGINTGRYLKQPNIKYPIQHFISNKQRKSVSEQNTEKYQVVIIKKFDSVQNKRIEKTRYEEINHCKKCGCMISKKATFCKQCYNELSRKSIRPSKENFIQDIINTSFCEMGIKYGVSEATIRKWCSYYQLPKKKKEILQIYCPEKIKTKEKTKAKHFKCTVNQYKNGEFIKTYNSVAEAEKVSGITHIYDVCNGKRKTAGGYQWIYGGALCHNT